MNKVIKYVNPLHISNNRRVPALIMPRGVGDKHFCAFNQIRSYSYSGVELYLPDELWLTPSHYCLWLYLNSSFVWLFREINGRKNLGGGLLKAEAIDMRSLPISFHFDFDKEAKEIYSKLEKREVLPVNSELETPEHIEIDRIVMEYFEVSDMTDQLVNFLKETVHYRASKKS